MVRRYIRYAGLLLVTYFYPYLLAGIYIDICLCFNQYEIKRGMKNLLSLCTLVLLSNITFANIQISPDILYKDQPATITTETPVDTIVITYRPNSQVSTIEYLSASAPATSFEWTPAQAGVVAIQAGGASTTVSVRFQGVSWSGIGIMVIAGFLLFGGATYAFRLLMYGKTPDDLSIDIQHRVDT